MFGGTRLVPCAAPPAVFIGSEELFVRRATTVMSTSTQNKLARYTHRESDRCLSRNVYLVHPSTGKHCAYKFRYCIDCSLKRVGKSMNCKRSKYFVPSSLLASQTTDRAARARRRALKTQSLTYSDLLERQHFLVTTAQLNPQTAANRAAALRAFLRANRVDINDPVGEEMRRGYPDCLEQFLDALRNASSPQKHVTNSKSAIQTWRQLVVEWDTAQAVAGEKPTPFQVMLKDMIGQLPIKRVARQANVPYDMLLGWTAGKLPRASSVLQISRLESFFGMERGSLTASTGLSHTPRLFPQLGEVVRIEYRETLSARTQDHYWLKVAEGSPLRKQWADFVEYKTAPVPVLERSNKGQWRISPLPLVRDTPANWFRFLHGAEVPSASAGWAKVAGFLGWCALPEARFGAAISEEKLQTLAWLVEPSLLQRYVRWRRERDTKLTSAVPEMLGWLQSLLRAEVGYFPQSPWLRETLPEEYRSQDWQAMCATQFTVCRRLLQSMKGEVEVSRDPFAPIEHVVALDEPLEALADMVQRMRADRPVGSPIGEAIWARDILLVKLLASNPLRMRQFAHLRWRADNTGNLYQKHDGSWHIHWRSRFFKNARYAASDMDYDSPVQETVWPDIEAFLFKYRPRLMRGTTDLVFFAQPTTKDGLPRPHRPWAELSRRIQVLTGRYLWRCPGVGGHSMRYLTGTAIIKAAPGDYTTVARVLNDRPLTVQKNYARFTSGDASKRMGELLKKSFRRM